MTFNEYVKVLLWVYNGDRSDRLKENRCKYPNPLKVIFHAPENKIMPGPFKSKSFLDFHGLSFYNIQIPAPPLPLIRYVTIFMNTFYEGFIIAGCIYCTPPPPPPRVGNSNIFYRDVWSQVSITYPLWCKLTEK